MIFFLLYLASLQILLNLPSQFLFHSCWVWIWWNSDFLLNVFTTYYSCSRVSIDINCSQVLSKFSMQPENALSQDMARLEFSTPTSITRNKGLVQHYFLPWSATNWKWSTSCHQFSESKLKTEILNLQIQICALEDSTFTRIQIPLILSPQVRMHIVSDWKTEHRTLDKESGWLKLILSSSFLGNIKSIWKNLCEHSVLSLT